MSGSCRWGGTMCSVDRQIRVADRPRREQHPVGRDPPFVHMRPECRGQLDESDDRVRSALECREALLGQFVCATLELSRENRQLVGITLRHGLERTRLGVLETVEEAGANRPNAPSALRRGCLARLPDELHVVGHDGARLVGLPILVGGTSVAWPLLGEIESPSGWWRSDEQV